jgi:putative transposase
MSAFVSIHGPIANLFHYPRNHMTAAHHRDLRNAAMARRDEITVAGAA